jgi:hypothetical protein
LDLRQIRELKLSPGIFARRLSKDDAPRMAQQILRLPEFVTIARGIDPSEGD